MDRDRQKRKPQFGFEVNEELLSELRDVAEKTQIPAAQIAREALWEKLADLRRSHPALVRESAEVPA